MGAGPLRIRRFDPRHRLIAGLDSHRPLHAPASQLLFGCDPSIDVGAEVAEPTAAGA